MQRFREEQITPGVIVVYTLRADQRPRHPEKEWRGKVLRYETSPPHSLHIPAVTLTDDISPKVSVLCLIYFNYDEIIVYGW